MCKNYFSYIFYSFYVNFNLYFPALNSINIIKMATCNIIYSICIHSKLLTQLSFVSWLSFHTQKVNKVLCSVVYVVIIK